jgi:O-acetyl-ADP-ribose deacetylase (regulator of RNase III)
MNPIVNEGNIIDAKTDVIVNAWNRNIIPWFLLLPQGVSGAIKKKAGIKPFNELLLKGPIPLGQAVKTGAGKLNYKAIIHVAGINMLWRANEYSIQNSIINAMKIVKENGYSSVTFPVIGAGSGGYDEEQALKIMFSTFELVQSSSVVYITKFKK